MTEKSRRQTGDKRRRSNVKSFDPFDCAQGRRAQDKLSNKEHRSKGAQGTRGDKAQATSAREKTQRRIVRKSLARQDIRKAI